MDSNKRKRFLTINRKKKKEKEKKKKKKKESLKLIRMMTQNCGKEEKLNEKREVKN